MNELILSTPLQVQERSWQRWPGEGSPEWSAFRFYRDTPPVDRSIAYCVSIYYGPDDDLIAKERMWKRWAKRYAWQSRVRAWEEYQDAVARHAEIEAIREMKNRHVVLAQQVMAKAAQRLSTMDAQELTAKELLEYLVESAKLERLSRGEPETIGAIQQRIDQTVQINFTTEQLRTISDIVGLDEVVDVVGGQFEEISIAGYLDGPHDEEE